MGVQWERSARAARLGAQECLERGGDDLRRLFVRPVAGLRDLDDLRVGEQSAPPIELRSPERRVAGAPNDQGRPIAERSGPGLEHGVVIARRQERVRQGLFREDLMHRLNVVRLRLPPLRERVEDIAPLARHFLQKSARDLAVEPKALSEDAQKVLTQFAFPGNVRQLENVCHWLTVMAPGQTVEVKDLPPELRTESGERADTAWTEALKREVAKSLIRGEHDIMDRMSRDFERILIAQALAHTAGRRIEAAGLLGIGRNTITRKIQELGLDK